MKSDIKYRLILTSFIVIFLSCKKEHKETNDYDILSVVLNSAFGGESDMENGAGWIDDTKEYNSLIFLNHTYLRKEDIENIDSYIKYGGVTGFSIDDFRKKHEWDIEKINNYKRYRLEEYSEQNIRSPNIGMVQISSIGYNKDFDEALVFISFLCAGNGDCGYSRIFYLKKEGNWVVKNEEELSVS